MPYIPHIVSHKIKRGARFYLHAAEPQLGQSYPRAQLIQITKVLPFTVPAVDVFSVPDIQTESPLAVCSKSSL